MFTQFLPTFKVMEPNNLTGLRTGQILSQFEANTTGIAKVTKGSQDFIENGILVGLTNTGKIESFDKTKHDAMFVHYTEVLNTLVDEDKYFAVPVETNTYPRCVALYVGDTYTTDNYSGTLSSTTLYAKVVNGVATLQDAADDDTAFAVKQSILANGNTAAELTFIKLPRVDNVAAGE